MPQFRAVENCMQTVVKVSEGAASIGILRFSLNNIESMVERN